MLIVSLLVASFVIFAAIYLAPGNPIAALSGGRSIPPDSLRVLEAGYHLDQPFLVQYWYWLSNALHGNLGISITLRENVSDLIASRISTTAGLVLYSSILIIAIGVGLGIISGLRPGLIDTSTLVITAVSASLPAFVAAIVLILVFAVQLQWFPSLGNGIGFFDQGKQLTLPAFALAVSSPAIVCRAQLSRRHVLRNAAIPITTISGITVASLIAVAAVVEVVFGPAGLGAYLVQSAQSKDLAVFPGISLLLVTAFVVVNVLVDVLYAVLDPRVSLGSRAQ